MIVYDLTRYLLIRLIGRPQWSRFRRGSWIAWIFLLVLGSEPCLSQSPSPVNSIECKIVLWSNGRLYFACGEESVVLPGAPFRIRYHDSTLIEGQIEFSGPGISWSDSLDIVFSDSLIMSRQYKATIDRPEIDTATTIRIAVLNPEDTRFLLGEDSPIEVIYTKLGNLIELVPRNNLQMEIENESFHGAIGFNRRPSTKANWRTISTPAPFVAVMIPNLRSDWGADGSLSTSLYYRFNDANPATLFGGDSALPLRSFEVANEQDARLYRYSPQTGRALMANLPYKSDTVSMSVSDRSLENAALFFADVIARDRIPVKIVTNREVADIRIEYIPFDPHDQLTCYRVILERIEVDEKLPQAAREALDLIAIRLTRSSEATDSSAADYHLRLIERSMTEDLGVFPLLRPILYWHHSSQLQSTGFDMKGHPELQDITFIGKIKTGGESK